MVQLDPVIELNTFSIVAREGETGAFGVAVATARPSVGSLVPWVSLKGAVATQASGVAPAFKFSGSHRYPWFAALVLALAASASASYFNRTFYTLTDRSITGEIRSVEEGKGDRWHVTVNVPDSLPQRYLISKDAATALKNEKQVRLGIARGALGFEFVARFEPYRP